MARLRSVQLIAICALCLSAAGGASPAPAAAAKKGHATARAHSRAGRCAKRSSYRASGGHSPRRRSATSCRRHGSHSHGRRSTRARSGHYRAHRQPRRGSRPAAQGKPRAALATPLPTNGQCPDSGLAPNSWDLHRVRVATLCLINRERGTRGEVPLAPNARLEAAAQGHTESMAWGDYFEHIGPHGETPLSRMRAAGYIYSSGIGFEVGENIGWGTLWEGTPRAIVAAWMASPGHRANILDPRFRDTGVGVSPHPPRYLAQRQAGGIYTQDFGGY